MSFLRDLQDAFKDRVAAHDYIADTGGSPAKPVTVLSDRRGFIDREIKKALTALGVAVIVAEPKVNPGERPMSVVVRIPVVIIENPTSKPKQAGYDVGEACMDQLWGWKPTPGGVEVFSSVGFESFQPVAVPSVEGVRDVVAWDQVYNVKFIKG